jgi:hypothetical protein
VCDLRCGLVSKGEAIGRSAHIAAFFRSELLERLRIAIVLIGIFSGGVDCAL